MKLERNRDTGAVFAETRTCAELRGCALSVVSIGQNYFPTLRFSEIRHPSGLHEAEREDIPRTLTIFRPYPNGSMQLYPYYQFARS